MIGALLLQFRVISTPGAKQLVRYAIAGFCVTQAAALLYSFLAVSGHLTPLDANAASTSCGIFVGYLVHNYWSFQGGAAKSHASKVARFALTTLLAFLFNSFWVWILVLELHWPPLTPVPIMMFVTPWISFLFNRLWVFKACSSEF